MTHRDATYEPTPTERDAVPQLRLIVGRSTTRLNCPRCEAPTLIEVMQSGIPIDRCQRCGGVWLDSGELERFVAP